MEAVEMGAKAYLPPSLYAGYGGKLEPAMEFPGRLHCGNKIQNKSGGWRC